MEEKHGLIQNQKKSVDAWKDGSIVGTYESIAEASRQLHVSETSISNCVSGAKKAARGYQFTAHGTTDPKPTDPCAVPTEVWKGNVFIGVYKSMAAAGRAFGISSGEVSRVVRGMKPEKLGYVFKAASGTAVAMPLPIDVPQTTSSRKGSSTYNSRPIEAYKGGILIGAFNSVMDAGRSLGISPTSITLVANGFAPETRGISFKYVSSEIPPKMFATEVWEGDALIGTYCSQAEAGKALGISASAISAIVRGAAQNNTPYTFKRVPTPDPAEPPTPPVLPTETEAAEAPDPETTDPGTPAVPKSAEDAPELDPFEEYSPSFRLPTFWNGSLTGERANSHLVSLMEREIQEAGWIVTSPHGDGFLRHLECIIREANHCVDKFKPSVMFRTYMGIKLSIAEYAYSWRIFSGLAKKDYQDVIECMRLLYTIREALNFCRFESFTPIGPKNDFSLIPPNRIMWTTENPAPEWVRRENARLLDAAKTWAEKDCNFDEMKELCEKWDKEDEEKERRWYAEHPDA